MFLFNCPGEASCLSSNQGPSNVTYDECDVAKRALLAKRLYSSGVSSAANAHLGLLGPAVCS